MHTKPELSVSSEEPSDSQKKPPLFGRSLLVSSTSQKGVPICGINFKDAYSSCIVRGVAIAVETGIT